MQNADPTNNAVLTKSFSFAVRVMKLRRFLCYEAEIKEFDISKQLLRSGTSVGANVEEAQGGQSPADFLSKMSIAYKEARESRYWIRLLAKAGYISSDAEQSLMNDVEELCKLLSSIIITTKTSVANNS